MLSPLKLCRSLLFLPASNQRAIAKARTLDADMLILDLEDSVRPEEKEAARAAAIAALEEGFRGRLTAVRINGSGTAWHSGDLAAVVASRANYLVVPKVETGHEAQAVAAAGKPVVAMIETAAGVLAAPEIASASAALLVGTNDLRAELGIPPQASREGLMHAVQAVVLAARASRAAAFDGVYNRLDDEAGFAKECREGRSFGFDGKSLIHPSQIATANHVFSPGEEEVAEAERLVAAAKGGAERFEGRMIESMHVAEAQAVLAKARKPS